MSQDVQLSNNAIDDLQGLELETFKIEEIDQLDMDVAEVKISACSSTTSSSCG